MITPDRGRPLPAAAALIGTGLLAAVLATLVEQAAGEGADALDIGEARVAMRWREFDKAIRLLRDVEERHPNSSGIVVRRTGETLAVLLARYRRV